MTSVFVRELKQYDLSELCTLFNLSLEKTKDIIRKLKEIGILKTLSKKRFSNTFDEIFDKDLVLTDEISTDNNTKFVFNFVGIIIISDLILNCYPKYILSSEKPIKEFKQILKVLHKYFNRKQEIKLFESDSLIKSNSRLALYLFLMDDYFENGIYTKDQIIEEINGNGEINWNQTVNKDSVFIDNNIPYYYELITRKRLSDERNYVKQIHEVILTLISQELNEIQFLDLFDLTDIYLSERNLSDFGNNDLIIYNLEKALNEEFNTRKRSVILALIAYLNQKNRINDINCITIYGTNSFNLIWEDVCQVIFNNQLDYPLEFLTLPIPLKKHFNKSETLKELIEKPFWKITGNYAQETFIPDIVNIQKFDENYYFLIFDAKYYTARLIPGKIPRKQPGIESVSKQFLYQLAFKEFIKEHKFDFVKNFFILPSEGNIVIDKEQVKMDIMNGINLEDIEIRLIPAKLAYFLYLKDQKFNLNDLGITEREN